MRPFFSSSASPSQSLSHGCQMVIAGFLDRMCLALRASGLWLCYAAKFDPFLSLDCAPTPSTLAKSKERKGSNFAIWQPCVKGRTRRFVDISETSCLPLPSSRLLNPLVLVRSFHRPSVRPWFVIVIASLNVFFARSESRMNRSTDRRSKT